MEGSSRSIDRRHPAGAKRRTWGLYFFSPCSRPRRLLVALALLPALSPPFATQTVPLPLEPSARIVGSEHYTVDLLIPEHRDRP